MSETWSDSSRTRVLNDDGHDHVIVAVTYNLLRARLQDAKVAKIRPLSCLQLSHQDFRGPSEAVLLYVVDKFYRSIASFPHAAHGRHSSLASRSGHQCHGPDTLCVTACEFSCWVSTLTTLLVRMPGLKHLNAYANGPAMVSHTFSWPSRKVQSLIWIDFRYPVGRGRSLAEKWPCLVSSPSHCFSMFHSSMGKLHRSFRVFNLPQHTRCLHFKSLTYRATNICPWTLLLIMSRRF